MMEVFAGFLSHTDHHLGRLLDYLEETGQLDNTIVMVISDNGASAEGGPTGTTNEAQFFNNAQEPVEDSLAAIDELGGPNHFNHYPWGWTWAGNTPFRRWKRETYRGGSTDPFIVSWRCRSAGAGRAAHAVRPHHRHGARPCSTCSGSQPPASIRGVTQSPLHGVSLAPRPARRRRRRATTTPSTSRCSATAPSTTTAGGPCARGPDPPSPKPASGFGAADLGRQAHRARRHRLGAVPRRRGPRRDPQPRRRAPRPADRHDRHLVRGGRQVRRDARRRQRTGPDHRRETDRRRATRPVRLPAEHPVGPVQRRAEGAQPPAQHHRRGRHPRRRRRGRPAVPRHRRRRLLVLRQGRHACTTSTTTSGAACYSVSSPDALPTGAHELRFEFEPTGPPDLANGKGTPGRLQLYVDGTLVADAEAPETTPFMFNPGGLTCGANPGSPVTPDYTSPIPVHRHHPHRHRRRQRRPDPRPRGRATSPHGTPVARRRPTLPSVSGSTTPDVAFPDTDRNPLMAGPGVGGR